MNFGQFTLLVAALAICAPALAGNTGKLTRKGKTATVTAIYVEPARMAQGSDTVVFSDDAGIAKAVSEKAKATYATTDGIFSADHLVRDLSDRGAHPLALSVGPEDSDGTRTVDLVMIETKGARETHLHSDKVQLHVDNDDAKRIAGTVKYSDKGLSMDLAFDLAKGEL